MYDGSFKYDEKVAKNYESDRLGDGHWSVENQFVENYLSKNKFDKILDLPVGTGRFLEMYTPNVSVVGIDISESMLAIASEKQVKAKVDLSKGDVTNLQFPDNFFDLVICFRLIHLIPIELRSKALSELIRVSENKVLVQLYIEKKVNFKDKFINKFFQVAKKTGLIKEEETWLHITSYPTNLDDILNIVKSCGARVNSVKKICDYISTEVVVIEIEK